MPSVEEIADARLRLGSRSEREVELVSLILHQENFFQGCLEELHCRLTEVGYDETAKKVLTRGLDNCHASRDFDIIPGQVLGEEKPMLAKLLEILIGIKVELTSPPPRCISKVVDLTDDAIAEVERLTEVSTMKTETAAEASEEWGHTERQEESKQ